MESERIIVAGAGSIGFYVGGLLAAAGKRVTFLGRSRLNDVAAEHGLHLTDFNGLSRTLPPRQLALTTNPEALMAADLILVCVKDGATEDMAALIAEHASPAAPVISLQNGLAAARALKAALPGRDVRAGMVMFNVVPQGPGHFHKATEGEIVIASGPGHLAVKLCVEGLNVNETDEIEAVQWGKLLLNLVNALNGLSGLPLRNFLLDRDWRTLVADQMAEALSVLQTAGQSVQKATPLPTALLPHVLRLPTPLFRRVAARMLTVDPSARTSMSYDLDAGRPTEISALQGEVISLGDAVGYPAPINQAVLDIVRSYEGQSMTAQTNRPTPDGIRQRAAAM
ncbi:MAG: 2-dehydropantoate 2-reductase [Arenibacterium sp.]